MSSPAKLMRVGELARAAGKSVRALHLYEELGLLRPTTRSSGGFRLYHPDAIDRINWLIKLQAIGFTLTEIKGFVVEFEHAQSGRTATDRVRHVFQEKLDATREQIAQLQVVENDLVEALEYLESCHSCAPSYAPEECGTCNQLGHDPAEAPELFAGLSKTYDVDVEKLRSQGTDAGPAGPGRKLN
jgi:DNA-binding transcriptional MerR regulator